MRGRIIFLLEEPSMATLLNGLLPRMFPGWAAGQQFLCVPHEGKSDLERSLPRKLRNWQIPDDRFVVVRDNDAHPDCHVHKRRLSESCASHGRPDTLVRLICQELESWYVGDLAALALAYEMPSLDSTRSRRKYAMPDAIAKPSAELKREIRTFQKGDAARRMAALLNPAVNRSPSFAVFLTGVRRLADEMGDVRATQ